MDRITSLERDVRALYESRNPERSDWCDWMYAYHVFVTVDHALRLAEEHSGNIEYCYAGALLHDIADAVMSRFDAQHETANLRIADELLSASGFAADERMFISDILRQHSCPDDCQPAHLDGQIVATADAIAHIDSDFYLYAAWWQGRTGQSFTELHEWTAAKQQRDLNVKICFADERTYWQQRVCCATCGCAGKRV